MKTKNEVPAKLTGLARQISFLESIKTGENEDVSFFVTETVMESMRDNGYRDIRKALNDLIDNSLQAGAKKVVVSTTSAKENAKHAREKITNIAVIDDGHGMLPGMLPIAIKWGGTDRHGERDGLGRFGFGLPTASISVTRTYEVYSKVKGGDWYKIKVDLDQIAKNALAKASGESVSFSPKIEKATPPDFVIDRFKAIWKKDDLDHGTAIVLLNPDRIRSFAIPQKFQDKIMLNIGLTYRHFIPDVKFYVNDKKVDMIDPLFLNPICRAYDVGNGYLAESLDELNISVKNKLVSGKEVEGNITLRFSFLHPNFQNEPDSNKIIKNRLETMKENNGYFIVCRAGRQIDVIKEANYQTDGDNITIGNNDRNWAIELDFDPSLDELFGITTNKQQVEIDETLWDILHSHDIPATVRFLRNRGSKIRYGEEAQQEKEKITSRDSEQIMGESSKFDALDLPDEKKEEGNKKIKVAASKKAKKEKVSEKVAEEELTIQAEKSRFKIEFVDRPGAPFYDVEMYGPQMIVNINIDHLFYRNIFSQQNKNGKTALELLLFVLGKCEIEAVEEKLMFYQNERFEWSRKLKLRLELQDKLSPILDKKEEEEEEKSGRS